MTPDATKYKPDPEYLRFLLKKAGIGQRKAAQIIGINERSMRQYFADRKAATALNVSYPVQFCLEVLALDKQPTCSLCGYHGLNDWLDDGETCPNCKLVQ